MNPEKPPTLCPNCGMEVRDDRARCPNCGASAHPPTSASSGVHRVLSVVLLCVFGLIFLVGAVFGACLYALEPRNTVGQHPESGFIAFLVIGLAVVGSLIAYVVFAYRRRR